MDKGMGLVAVGVVHTRVREPGEAPRQGRDQGTSARLEIFPPYRQALEGLEEWPRLLVICWMHRSPRDVLTVSPRRDTRRSRAGVFASRSPARPNPLAIYTVELLELLEDGMVVRGIDAVEGTPVLDIKPFIPRLDD